MAIVRKILISQNAPHNMAPYEALTEKFGVRFDFKPFFIVEPLTSREFRTQRINILDYTAVVFSSRHAINAYFQLCEELRVKVPETMKYFCTTEAVAMYLQKHIVYRKRKIFFGDGTPASILSLIGTKHAGETFLIVTSDSSNSENITRLFDEKKLNYKTAVFVKSVSQDLKGVDFSAYELAVLYNPADVKSLYENFPDFRQGDLKFISYGKTIVKAMEEAGLNIAIKAPTPEVPSAAKAIELYLSTQ
ncbi:MAG: uroporphyrinogen-III synthase [Bacteroidales bacterium]|nr:uroporphyrinogen-III synthase [Bacteroidales bacterium]